MGFRRSGLGVCKGLPSLCYHQEHRVGDLETHPTRINGQILVLLLGLDNGDSLGDAW